MSDHDHARTAVLGRIRAALGAEPPAPVVVPRDYDRERFSGGGDVARFAETVAEYRAQVTRIDAAAIGATVASLVPTGARVVVPADLPAAWVERVDALADNPADPLSITQLETAAAVVTGCAVGIAVLSFLVFDRWFLIPMPKGPLETWLGY